MALVKQKVLSTALRRLEADGVIWRQSEAMVSPHVTYGLTERGLVLAPVFDALARWRLGNVHGPPAAPPEPAAR